MARIPKERAEILATPVDNGIVSVIIPTYNMADTVMKSVQSCLSQDYPKVEIVVVDDGSTDNTKDLIFSDGVKYVYQDNLGCAGALNTGIKESIGQYICWLSADDYYIDDQAISKRVAKLEEKGLDFVHSWFKNKVNDGLIQEYATEMFTDMLQAYEHNKKICWINGSTLLLRRKVFHNIGLFNTCYRYIQDWDFWFRLLKYHKGEAIPQYLVERGAKKGILATEVLDTPEGKARYDKEKEAVYKYLRMLEQPHPTICAILVTKNEGFLIEQCLDDLIQWVDKIVVFNDGSTDDTLARIQKYPKVVDIFNSPPKGNVRTEGMDRSKALQMAQATGCDWGLFVDTDEVFEHPMKWRVFDLITDPTVNCYIFHEINFWRGYDHYRTDELWNTGEFRRLFRMIPGLEVTDLRNEHACQVPVIPGNQKDGGCAVKHYGFVDWERNVSKYKGKMERDPFDPETGWGGAYFYDRMVNEVGLTLHEYLGEQAGDRC